MDSMYLDLLSIMSWSMFIMFTVAQVMFLFTFVLD